MSDGLPYHGARRARTRRPEVLDAPCNRLPRYGAKGTRWKWYCWMNAGFSDPDHLPNLRYNF